MKEAPLSRASDYLRKLPKDIQAAAAVLQEAKTTTDLRSTFKDEFIKTFTAHEQVLKNFRDKIEKIIASANSQAASQILDPAHQSVTTFRNHSKSFKRSCDVYAKQREKSAGKDAKAKQEAAIEPY